jgi:hypothetical protein
MRVGEQGENMDERTSLMSLGDDACRFRVMRTDDPLAPGTDALDQRLSGGQAAG